MISSYVLIFLWRGFSWSYISRGNNHLLMITLLLLFLNLGVAEEGIVIEEVFVTLKITIRTLIYKTYYQTCCCTNTNTNTPTDHLISTLNRFSPSWFLEGRVGVSC